MTKIVTLLIDYPGYWLDGEILTGYKARLHLGKRKWSKPPTTGNAPSGEEVDCYLVTDPDTGEKFGIPTNRVVVLTEPPVIDLRGQLGRKDNGSSIHPSPLQGLQEPREADESF